MNGKSISIYVCWYKRVVSATIQNSTTLLSVHSNWERYIFETVFPLIRKIDRHDYVNSCLK